MFFCLHTIQDENFQSENLQIARCNFPIIERRYLCNILACVSQSECRFSVDNLVMVLMVMGRVQANKFIFSMHGKLNYSMKHGMTWKKYCETVRLHYKSNFKVRFRECQATQKDVHYSAEIKGVTCVDSSITYFVFWRVRVATLRNVSMQIKIGRTLRKRQFLDLKFSEFCIEVAVAIRSSYQSAKVFFGIEVDTLLLYHKNVSFHEETSQNFH